MSFEAAVLVVLGCFVGGLLLLLVEVVLVPGHGLPGVAGTALLLFGSCYALWTGGFVWGFATIAGAGAILGVALRALGFTLGPRIVLDEALPTPPSRLEDLIGHRGIALTPLRPVGLARLDGRRTDVVSRSEWVEAGTPLRVTNVESSRLLVERDSGEAATSRRRPSP